MKLGLIGHPVSHSISPVLHNAALHHYGLGGDYLLFDVLTEDVPDLLARLAGEGYTGLNVTVPHKLTVIPHMASLSETARKCGAVNTIKFDGETKSGSTMTGHNTDAEGFLHALTEHKMLENATKGKVAVIGAGGAARAILAMLASVGASHITVIARDVQKGKALIAELIERGCLPATAEAGLEIDCVEPQRAIVREFSLIVNCAPLGLSTDGTAHAELPTVMQGILAECTNSRSAVYDTVYGKSLFRRPCEQMGVAFADGFEMLLGQAALAFEFWTGKKVPIEVMREAALRHHP